MLKTEKILQGIPIARFRASITCVSEGFGWNDIFVGDVASMIEYPHQNGGAEGFVNFAFDEPVRLRLLFPAKVESAVFRPSLRSKIDVAILGTTVEMTFDKPRFGVLEVNYSSMNLPCYTVYILGDNVIEEPEESMLTRQIEPGWHSQLDLEYGDAQTLCFSPGLHEIEGGELTLVSGHNIHLSRGAVIRASLFGDNVENVKITGQGIFDGSGTLRLAGIDHLSDSGRPGFFVFYKGQNILLDGCLLYNPSFWNIVPVGTKHLTIRNHKALAWIGNTDGIQPRSCSELLVENCFLKCNDDCIAVKTRRAIGMVSRNLVFKNLVLWNDLYGNALEIGHSSQGDLLENLVFKDIDVIRGTERAAVDICITDHSLVRNLLYEGINVEGAKFLYDFAFMLSQDQTYGSNDRSGHVSDVHIKTFRSDGAPRGALIKGIEGDPIENVLFEDIRFNCAAPDSEWKASSPEELEMDAGFASEIVVK